MIKKNILCMSIMATLMLTSCYHEIDLDNYRDQMGKDLLTINSVVNPDSTVVAIATKTYYYTDKYKGLQYVDDLNMQLWVNGEYEEQMKFDGKFYRSNYYPKVNDQIELKTTYLGEPVTAKDVVPRKVEIEDIKIEYNGYVSMGWNSGNMYTYYITFSDLPDVEDYYYLQILCVSSMYGYVRYDTPLGIEFTDDFVFQQLSKRVAGSLGNWTPTGHLGLPFTDEGIEGKKYTIVLREIDRNNMGYMEYDKRLIKLSSISKAYFDYKIDLLRLDPLDKGIEGGMIDIGLTEPLKVYSNIDGGVGILGCYNTSTALLTLPKK